MTGAEAGAAIDVRHLQKPMARPWRSAMSRSRQQRGRSSVCSARTGRARTTTVECVTGLRHADDGQVRILGLDPARDREQLRLVVGVQLQSGALPDKLKVGEALGLYQSFYPDPADAEELASALGLEDKRDACYQSLSGGQKQRLSIALALIGQPKAAVLDEMTTGLDPHARREVWDLIELLRARGVTILLVTHNMEEAARLCDQVALVDRGRIVAAGTPQELARRVGAGKQVNFTPSVPFDDALLTRLPEVSAVEHHGQRVQVTGAPDPAPSPQTRRTPDRGEPRSRIVAPRIWQASRVM
jgi:ABC-2 type transport system ATP-binding protein